MLLAAIRGLEELERRRRKVIRQALESIRTVYTALIQAASVTWSKFVVVIDSRYVAEGTTKWLLQ